jgi:hypothetical protein
MNPFYAATVALHVVVAVVGVGMLGAIPIVARAARMAAKTSGPSAPAGAPLDALFHWTRVSLATMAITGILLDVAVAGAFHTSTWFRASGALVVVLAVSHARARAAWRSAANASGASAAPGADATESARCAALSRVERLGWTMCATVALIAILMEVKPFQ